LTWFAEEFSLTVDLAIIEDDLIKATIKVRKLVRNLSNIRHPIESFIHIDEWGHKYKSDIVDCEIRTQARGTIKKLDSEKTQIIGSSIRGTTGEIMVGPGELVELLAEGVEYKRFNDDIHYSLGYAAHAPVINISNLSGFHISGGISTFAEQQKHPHLICYQLAGFYFPHQRMIVRWYPNGTADQQAPRYGPRKTN
jgi:hypothetical protein